MFWFLLITMVVVVAAVTLAVVGGGESEVLPEAAPEQLVDPLPTARPVDRADVEALRLPVAARGYRMADVDDVLVRLGAELAERDARIAELEEALTGGGGGGGTGPGPGFGAGPALGAGPVPGSGSAPGSGSGDAEDDRP
ncbi:hypothetical protein [Streptomyces sp. NPDC088915]|uniref:hypothetical protein n=1 Tax=Streptomyces sp. NPDC088915 TaxID=3365912 RepID=UPI0038071579